MQLWVRTDASLPPSPPTAPLVGFEVESRDVKIDPFSDSDPAYDLLLITALWEQRQSCSSGPFELVAWTDLAY